MASPPSTSRRTVLGLCGAAAAALAGCTGTGDPGTSRTTPPDTEPPSTTPATTGPPPTGSDSTDDPLAEADWSFDAGAVALGPAYRDGTLYVGTGDGVLYALDPASGEERWSFETAGFFRGTPADYSPMLAGGSLYAVSGRQSGAHGERFALYALDPASGEERWSVGVDYPNFLGLLGADDETAYAATGDDYLGADGETLYALDAADGSERWTATVGDPREGAVTDAGVFVATQPELQAVADGAVQWRDEGATAAGPAPLDDTLLAATFDGELRGYDPANGTVRWSVGDRRVTTIAVADRAYVGGDHVAAYAADGTRRWHVESSGLVRPGSVVEDTVYVGGSTVRALATADGTERWHHAVDAEMGVPVAVGGGVVVVRPGNQSRLLCLDAASGDVRWDVDGVGAPAVADGTTYVADHDGAVYALR